MRGAVIAFAELEGVEIVRGQELLTHYQFNSNTAQHYFCGRCGIYTHHQRRFNTRQFAINTACP